MANGWQAKVEAAVVEAAADGVPADEILVGLARVLLGTARATAGWVEGAGYDPDIDEMVQRALALAREPSLRVVE